MQKELSYLDSSGHTVFTSQFLKARGTCCKSACTHCPYGYTIKKCGIQFQEVTTTDENLINLIMNESGLASVDWKSYFPDNIRLIKVKEIVCGLFLKNHIVIKHLFLKPHFQNQDISKELVESYFFIN